MIIGFVSARKTKYKQKIKVFLHNIQNYAKSRK